MGSPQSAPPGHDTATYQLGRTTVSILRGDITTIKADALVTSDDNYLTMGGGASLALIKAGGKQVREDARKHVSLTLGDVVATTAGDLQAQYILFIVVSDFDRGVYAGEAQLSAAILRCLKLADALSVRSLAFPALATGFAGMPSVSAANVTLRAIADYVSEETGLTQIMLVEYAPPHLEEKTVEPDPGAFYTRAVELASELAQKRRFYDILDELQLLTIGGPLEQNLETLQREIENVKAGLRSIQERATAIQRVDQPALTTGQAALAEAPKMPGTEDVDLGALRRTLSKTLGKEEVKAATFDLGIDDDALDSTNKDVMIMELLITLIRRNSLQQLFSWLHTNRPDIELGTDAA